MKLSPLKYALRDIYVLNKTKLQLNLRKHSNNTKNEAIFFTVAVSLVLKNLQFFLHILT